MVNAVHRPSSATRPSVAPSGSTTPRGGSAHAHANVQRFTAAAALTADGAARAHANVVKRATAHLHLHRSVTHVSAGAPASASRASHHRHAAAAPAEVIETDAASPPRVASSSPFATADEDVQLPPQSTRNEAQAALVRARFEVQQRLERMLTPFQLSSARGRVGTIVGTTAVQSVPAATADSVARFSKATDHVSAFLDTLAASSEACRERDAVVAVAADETRQLLNQISRETKSLLALRPSLARPGSVPPADGAFIDRSSQASASPPQQQQQQQPPRSSVFVEDHAATAVDNDTFASIAAAPNGATPTAFLSNDTFATLTADAAFGAVRDKIRRALHHDDDDDGVDGDEDDDHHHMAAVVTPDNDSWGAPTPPLTSQQSTTAASAAAHHRRTAAEMLAEDEDTTPLPRARAGVADHDVDNHDNDVDEDASPAPAQFAVVDFSTPLQMVTGSATKNNEASL